MLDLFGYLCGLWLLAAFVFPYVQDMDMTWEEDGEGATWWSVGLLASLDQSPVPDSRHCTPPGDVIYVAPIRRYLPYVPGNLSHPGATEVGVRIMHTIPVGLDCHGCVWSKKCSSLGAQSVLCSR